MSKVSVVANILGVELESLAVDVTGDVDVRGTMAMDGQVPVVQTTYTITWSIAISPSGDGTREVRDLQPRSGPASSRSSSARTARRA